MSQTTVLVRKCALGLHETMSAGELAEVLERHWRCPSDVAHSVAACANEVKFASRQLIQSAQSTSLFVLVMVEGTAQALAYSLDGRLVLIEEFHCGDLFGEITAFAGQSENGCDEIVANTPIKAGQFAQPVFLALMEQHSSIALAVAFALTRRVSQANRKVVQIATVSAPGRVHAELLRLGKRQGDWRISPAPVLAELAVTVQSTRETVSRAVSNLEKRGIVNRDADALVIVAPHRLEEMIF